MMAEAQALVAACVAGDPEGRRSLVVRYHRAVRQAIGFLPVARAGRVRPEDVEDAVQQAFIAFFAHDARALTGWRHDASLRTYLCRIAERVASRHFHRVMGLSGRFRLDLDAPDATGETRMDRVSDEAPAADQRLGDAEACAELRCAIRAELSDTGRAYYDYLYVSELDVAEIAARENTNANNVYQWKNRIVRVARTVLRRQGLLSDDDG